MGSGVNQAPTVTMAPNTLVVSSSMQTLGLVYWGLTPQQQPGQGGEMMMKSVF